MKYDNPRFIYTTFRLPRYILHQSKTSRNVTLTVTAPASGALARAPRGRCSPSGRQTRIFYRSVTRDSATYREPCAKPGSGMYTAHIPNNWNITSVNEIAEQAAEMSIYPNPAKDQFKIETSAFANGNLQLTMTDLQGKMVLSQKIGFVKNKPISVQTNDLPSGIYLVQLSQNEKVVTEKLVITN